MRYLQGCHYSLIQFLEFPLPESGDKELMMVGHGRIEVKTREWQGRYKHKSDG